MFSKSALFRALLVFCSLLLLIGGAAAQDAITLQFFYPVGVAAGPSHRRLCG